MSNWLSPLPMFAPEHRRDPYSRPDGDQRGVKILYEGVMYPSISAAARTLCTSRYFIERKLGLRSRK